MYKKRIKTWRNYLIHTTFTHHPIKTSHFYFYWLTIINL